MKKYIFFLIVVIMLLLSRTAYAQNEGIEEQMQSIELEEKAALKEKIITINKRMEDSEIDLETAAELKEDAAMYHARRIKKRQSELQTKAVQQDSIPQEDDDEVIRIEIGKKKVEIKAKESTADSIPEGRRRFHRTTSSFSVSFGMFHTLTEGNSINDGPYDLGKSRAFEMASIFKTRLTNNSSLLNLHYGVGIGFYSLSISDNQFFARDGAETVLQRSDVSFDKNRFGITQVFAPLHLEFDFSKSSIIKNGKRPSSDQSIRIGVGGYGAVTVSSYAKQKYDKDGQRVKNKARGNFNTNTLVYGLSGYVGYKDFLIFAKYQLTPLFESNTVDEYPLVFGVRFEWK